MRTSRRRLIAAAVLLAVLLATVLTIAVPPLRSAAVLATLKIALAERGFALHAGRLSVAGDRVTADDVEIDDRTGALVLAAKRADALLDPAVWVGNSKRRFGVISLTLDRPVLRIARLADGSYNISGIGGGPPSTAPSAPLHADLAIRSGKFVFEDPAAPSKIGRRFVVDGIEASAHVDQGDVSTARASGAYEAPGSASAALTLSLSENDRARFAVATLRAEGLDAAPIVDGIVPTPSFVVERAPLHDVVLRAFAIDYDPSFFPQWQFSGSARLTGGVFRVRPLTHAVTGANGQLTFSGGHLSTGDLEGMLAGAPLHVAGGIRLLGGARLAIAASGDESLERLRHAFAFSDHLDVRGPVTAALRIEGPPSDVAVAGTFAATDTVWYGGLPFAPLSGTLFYDGGHLSLPVVRGAYDGADVSLAGDIDLSTAATTGRFALLAAAPAAGLPVAANVNPSGDARALGSLEGPLAALYGSGFIDVSGGNGATIRGAVTAGPAKFAVGPLLLRDPSGGELVASGGIDRSTAVRTVGGLIIARGATLRLLAAARSLPGIDDAYPIALPATEGAIDGIALVGGPASGPAVAIDARGDDVIVGATRLGSVRVVAAGRGGRVHVSQATIEGPDASLHLTGDAVVLPSRGRYAALLNGTGSTRLAAMPSIGGARAAGVAAGSFAIALAGDRWTVAVHATGQGANVEGLRLQTADATVGGGSGPTEIYAGTVSTSAGVISAIGDVPGETARTGRLDLWTQGFDVGSLSPPRDRVRGDAVMNASIEGSLEAPVISGAAALTQGRVGDQPVAGDVQVRYRDGRFDATGGRVVLAGGFANVDGSLTGLRSGASLRDARLALVASMREGDLRALTRRYLPSGVRLDGMVDATLDVGGTIREPHATGVVESASGTLQGVGFNGLHGVVDVSRNTIALSQGSVGVGSSMFDFGGSVSASAAHIRASSPNVDLADFNDFFEGYDTLDGHGYGQVAFESTARGIVGSGSVGLSDASVLGYPLGTLRADFASRGDQVLLSMRQSGDAGSSDLRGSITLPARRRALPDLREARYDMRGSVRGLDIGRVTPLFGKESLGITGYLDATGSLRGDLRSPSAHADVSVREGHIGRIAVDQATGSIDSDGKRASLRDVTLDFPFARIDGGGTIGPGDRVAASFGIDASDLGTLVALAGRPGVARGTALASVAVAGSLAAPHVTTTIVSGRGTALGVGFDRLSGTVTYEPGEVDIADAEVDLAGNRGVLTIGGTLPLQLEPFGLGPKNKPIDLRVAANAVDLAALEPLTSRYASMTGTLDAAGSVSGTAGRPQVSGSAKLRNASVSSPYETIPADHLRADLALAGDTLTLTHFSASLGRGSVAGSGSVHIVPAVGLLNVAGLQYWSRLDLRNAEIDVPGWTSGALNGDLRLTKSGSIPFLEGDVTLDDGTVPFAAIYRLASGYGSGPSPEGGSLPGVPDAQPGHIVVYGGSVFGEGGPFVRSAAPGVIASSTAPVLPSVDLDVNARAGRNVRVHGGAIDLTASGSVLLGGDLRSPTLAGTFTSARGQIGYFDTNFRLVRGVVTFDPVEGLLPTLDVKAITNLNGAEITLTVTGRVDNLQTDLSSNPSMSRDEIVATLLHAPQVQSVISATPGQAQTALYAEAQSYFNAQLARSLLFPVESLLAQTINVEQISLIYDQQGTVDVEVRKLITPTVYAIYRSSLNIPVTQTAGVAYSLRDYADLEVLQTQSASGLQQSVLNLRLTFH